MDSRRNWPTIRGNRVKGCSLPAVTSMLGGACRPLPRIRRSRIAAQFCSLYVVYILYTHLLLKICAKAQYFETKDVYTWRNCFTIVHGKALRVSLPRPHMRPTCTGAMLHIARLQAYASHRPAHRVLLARTTCALCRSRSQAALAVHRLCSPMRRCFASARAQMLRICAEQKCFAFLLL